MPPAYEVLLLNTAVPQIQAAQSGDTYVVPRDIAFSAALTLSAGTANGVPYLNGSKVLTTGSALTFDGTNLGVNTTPIGGGRISTIGDFSAVNGIVIQDSATTYANNDWYLLFRNSSGNSIAGLSHPAANSLGIWGNDDIRFLITGAQTEQMRLTSTGLGIGTSSPSYKLDVAWNDAITTRARLKNASSSSAAVTLLEIANNADNSLQIGQRSSAASDANESFIQNNAGGLLTLSTLGSTAIRFSTNTTERARITSGGDFQTSSGNSVMVGGTAARATTAGTNRVDIFDGTAPVGTLANGISLYSSSGEAYVMDAAGNATLFSPHDAVTNEWIFRSKHTPTGKVLKIDVERLLKFVNDHFGLDAVHEFIED